MANQRKSYPLRIDPKLFEEVRRLADRELRSVNAQIEFLLRDAVRRRTKHGLERTQQEGREAGQ